jgi:hypothetical protein
MRKQGKGDYRSEREIRQRMSDIEKARDKRLQVRKRD